MKNVRARGVTKDGKPIFPESVEHVRVAEWLDANQVFYFHPANGELRHPRVARQLKNMGVKPGVPDFVILDRPHNQPIGNGIVGVGLELKALDGAKPSEKQMDFMDRMVQRGWLCGWHRGAEAAIEWLKELGYEKRSR